MELDTAMTMNLNHVSKRGFLVYFAISAGVVLVATIIGYAGPNIQMEYTGTAYKSTFDMSVNSTKFPWEIKNLDKLNQQLSLDCSIHNTQYQSRGVVMKFVIGVQLDGSTDQKAWVKLADSKEQRTVTCTQGKERCDAVTILHEPFIHYQFYQVTVYFANVAVADSIWIGDVDFTWRTVNHKFTLFELWFRFTFLLATFICIFFFSYRLRHYQFSQWNLEQKYVACLLFALMGYNNPFFPLDILVDSWFPAFLDSLLTASFYAVLLVFWLSYFDYLPKLKYKRTMKLFWLPKIGFVLVIWIAAVTLFTWEQVHELDNPSYSAADDIPGFIFIRVSMLVLLVIYFFWFMYCVIRAWSDRKKIPFMDIRFKFLGGLTLVTVLITVIGFVLNANGVVPNTAAEFLGFFSLYNVYVYSLAYMWAPSTSSFNIDRGHEMRRLESESASGDDDMVLGFQERADEMQPDFEDEDNDEVALAATSTSAQHHTDS